jgi:hypothetical protein
MNLAKTSPSHDKISRQGFTLVEVLVSSFLTLIVMGMLFAVLMGTINAWEGGTSRLKSSGDARLALDILKTDLESMVVRQTQYNQEWLSSRPFHIDGSGAFKWGLSGTFSNNTWLTFFAPSLDRDSGQQGDIVALSYLNVYQDPISVAEISPIFGLYKAMTSTIEAFNKAMAFGSDALLIGDGSRAGYWTEGNPEPSPSDRKGFLAPNVVNFSVSWMVRKPGESTLTRFDETHFVRLSNSLVIFDSSGAIVLSEGKIEAADVSLTTVSDEGMRRYAFLNDPNKLGPIIKEFGRTHTLRVSINY